MKCLLITGMGAVAKSPLLISQHLPEEEMESPFSLVGRLQPVSSFLPQLPTENESSCSIHCKKSWGP